MRILARPLVKGLVRKLQSDQSDREQFRACKTTAYVTASFLDDMFPTSSQQLFAVLRAAGAGSCRAMAS